MADTIKNMFEEESGEPIFYKNLASSVKPKDPVVFEQYKKVRVSRATYEIVSYVDFHTVLHGFDELESYIDDFARQLKDPTKVLAYIRQSYIEDENRQRRNSEDGPETETKTGRNWAEHFKNLANRHEAMRTKHEQYFGTKPTIETFIRKKRDDGKSKAEEEKRKIWLSVWKQMHEGNILSLAGFVNPGSHDFDPTRNDFNPDEMNWDALHTTQVPSTVAPDVRRRITSVEQMHADCRTFERRGCIARFNKMSGFCRLLNYKCPWLKSWQGMENELDDMKELFYRIKERFYHAMGLEPDDFSAFLPQSKRKKRQFLLAMGLGVGGLVMARRNSKRIDHLEKTAKILQEQSDMEEAQIQQLGKNLNMTYQAVIGNRAAIFDINRALMNLGTIVNKNVKAIRQLRIQTMMLSELRTSLSEITLGISKMEFNVALIYEYLKVMTSNYLSPTTIAPTTLRRTLTEVKRDLEKKGTRVRLPIDPEVIGNVWQYYPICTIVPMITPRFLMVSLQIPLSDVSVALSIFRVHNLVMMSHRAQLAMRYLVEGEFLAVSHNMEYISIPPAGEVENCLIAKGYICQMTTALYPAVKSEWCVWHLFRFAFNMTHTRSDIQRYCKVEPAAGVKIEARALDDYLWAISLLKTTVLHVRCPNATHTVRVHPPVQLVHIPNGCEAQGLDIMLPTRTHWKAYEDIPDKSDYFLQFNRQYQNLTEIGAWADLGLEKFDVDGLKRITDRLPHIPPLNLSTLKWKLPHIGEPPHFAVSDTTLVGVIVTLSILIPLILIVVCYCLYKHRHQLQTLHGLKGYLTAQSGWPWPNPKLSKKKPKPHLIEEVERQKQEMEKEAKARKNNRAKVKRAVKEAFELMDVEPQPSTSGFVPLSKKDYKTVPTAPLDNPEASQISMQPSTHSVKFVNRP